MATALPALAMQEHAQQEVAAEVVAAGNSSEAMMMAPSAQTPQYRQHVPN